MTKTRRKIDAGLKARWLILLSVMRFTPTRSMPGRSSSWSMRRAPSMRVWAMTPKRRANARSRSCTPRSASLSSNGIYMRGYLSRGSRPRECAIAGALGCSQALISRFFWRLGSGRRGRSTWCRRALTAHQLISGSSMTACHDPACTAQTIEETGSHFLPAIGSPIEASNTHHPASGFQTNPEAQ